MHYRRTLTALKWKIHIRIVQIFSTQFARIRKPSFEIHTNLLHPPKKSQGTTNKFNNPPKHFLNLSLNLFNIIIGGLQPP